jgi:hypothetical protein
MSGSGCDRFDRATRREDARAWTELESHAAGCADCRERLTLWKEISAAAPALRKAWDSPDLLRRIEQAIGAGAPAESSASLDAPTRPASLLRFLPAAAVAALVVLSMVGVRVFRDSAGREPLTSLAPGREPLLTEQALSDVETAESAYLTSIEKLSLLARPRLADPSSPLSAAYREKLLMLDSAIAETRGEVERNRFNTHLRKELLAMYREKQRTLQDLMKVGQS